MDILDVLAHARVNDCVMIYLLKQKADLQLGHHLNQ